MKWLTALLLALTGCSPAASAPPAPGLVLVVVDTLRADALEDPESAPWMSTLAQEGLRFEQHRANAPWTKTSMASLLTGRWPSEHRALDIGTRADPALPTIAERLQAQGFATAAFLGNPIAGRSAGLQRGFQSFAEPAPDQLPSAEQLFERAGDWILEQPPDQPWFVLILPIEPHAPYAPAPKLRETHCPTCPAGALNEPEREYRGAGPNAEQVRHMRQLYKAEVHSLDEALRGFHQRLDDGGLWGRSAMVLTSDHGEAIGEHGVFGHAFHMWEEVLRVPLVIWGRGVRSGVVQGPTQGVDLAPTLLSLAGQPPVDELPGRPLVQGSGRATPEADPLVLAHVQMYGVQRISAIQGGQKLVWEAPLDQETFSRYHADPSVYPSLALEQERWTLYNLSADPEESHPESSPQNAALREAVQRHRVPAAARP